MDAGGVDGYGEACGFAEGYCVWLEGTWVKLELQAPACVRVDGIV